MNLNRPLPCLDCRCDVRAAGENAGPIAVDPE